MQSTLIRGEEESSGSVTLFFFLVIGVPIGLSFLGFPNFLVFFLGMVHEMGHFVAIILDAVLLPGTNRFFIVFAGPFTECFIPVFSFVLSFRDRRFFVISCLFLAATGTAFTDTGRYMSSALNPYGYAFISGRPLTTSNHDWSYLFRELDLLGSVDGISNLFILSGRVLELFGFYSALTGLLVYARKQRLKILLTGAVLSGIHSFLTGLYEGFAIFFLFVILLFTAITVLSE